MGAKAATGRIRILGEGIFWMVDLFLRGAAVVVMRPLRMGVAAT